MDGHVARMGETRNAYNIFVGKREGKRPLGRSKHTCYDDVIMDLREIIWESMVWIHLA